MKLLKKIEEGEVNYVNSPITPLNINIILGIYHNKSIDKIYFESDLQECLENNHIPKSIQVSHMFFIYASAGSFKLGLINKTKEDVIEKEDYKDIVISENKFLKLLNSLIEKYEELGEVIKLNEDYNAILTKDNVEVGCQKFDWETIDKIIRFRVNMLKE
jgi:hypothetical protein